MVLTPNDYAPVFIPTLCRYEHFKRCVESLARCTGAVHTKLIIGLDYPLKESHWDGYRKISAYIENITGFKEVEVLRREVNYGAVKNGREARKYIYKTYDRYIISEDDNEFSPNFLEYINKGLILFQNDPKYVAVCGYWYNFDSGVKDANAFWATGYSAWGFGLWRSKPFPHERYSANEYMGSVLGSWSKSLKLFMKAPKELNSLITMFTRNLIWGDVLICADCIIEGKGSIFPTISKVRNWGDDGSGLHCIHDEGLSNQVIDENSHFDFDEVALKSSLVYFSPHKLSFYIKILILLRYICLRVIRVDILSWHYKDRKA